MDIFLKKCFQDLYLFALILAVIITLVTGSGTLQVRMSRYVNSDGEGANGHCCDGRSIFCFSPCDHLFTLCLDDGRSSNNIDTCPFGKIRTGHINDANSITFGRSIGGTPNPLSFQFSDWPGYMRLKVRVEDHDDNSNDFVDYLYTTFYISPARTETQASELLYRLRKRTSLYVYVKVYCDPDYYGPTCSVYCKSRDDSSGHYSCDANTGRKMCMPGWIGSNCENSYNDCAENICQNGATCEDRHMRYTCTCPEGYQGKFCENDIDECSSVPCTHNGTCTNNVGSFVCSCKLPWTGSLCQERIDFCRDNPCNNSQCDSLDEGYNCTCIEGWEGNNCDINIDECLGSPCLNNATCFDLPGSFACQCEPGFIGELCEENIDECLNNTCQNNATCKDMVNSYACICASGYTGKSCEEEIDECASNPCQNGGTCNDVIAGFVCDCKDGFTGESCEINIDECVSDPCQNGGLCVDGINGYTCACTKGFNGLDCEFDINECELDIACKNNATCENMHGSFICHCTNDYTGSDCSTDLNTCRSDPCQNGGNCTNLVGEFGCACADGYTGNTCETDINECASNPCQNNGVCSDLVDMYVFSVEGNVGNQAMDLIREKITNMLNSSGDYSEKTTHLQMSYMPQKDENGERTTLVFVKVIQGEEPMSKSKLQTIFTPEREAELLSLVDSSNKQNTESSWWSSNWYIILAVGLGLTLLAALVTSLYVRHKRKTKQRDITTVDYWPNPQDLATLGFENIVYNVEHQPVYNNVNGDVLSQPPNDILLEEQTL